jgi:hypothetical protein
VSNANVYKLYHVSLSIRSLPKCGIPRLSGQWFLHVVYITGIYSQFLPLNFILKIVCTNCLVLSCHYCTFCFSLNHLTPNGHFSGRTAPLTYRCSIFFIYSTAIRSEYFKHATHSPFFPLKNAVYFIMLLFFFFFLFTF